MKPSNEEMERANFIVSVRSQGYSIEQARRLAEAFYKRKWWRKAEGRDNAAVQEIQNGG